WNLSRRQPETPELGAPLSVVRHTPQDRLRATHPPRIRPARLRSGRSRAGDIADAPSLLGHALAPGSIRSVAPGSPNPARFRLGTGGSQAGVIRRETARIGPGIESWKLRRGRHAD